MEAQIKDAEQQFRSQVFGPVFRLVLVAGSGMGKTHWLAKFLGQIDQLCPNKFTKIVVHFKSFNPIFQEMYVRDQDRIELRQELPEDLSDITSGAVSVRNTLWVFEDFISVSGSPEEKIIEQLFSKVSNNAGLSVAVTSQSIYNPSNKIWRSVSLNATHFCLWPVIRYGIFIFFNICQTNTLFHILGMSKC